MLIKKGIITSVENSTLMISDASANKACDTYQQGQHEKPHCGVIFAKNHVKLEKPIGRFMGNQQI